MIKHYFKTIKDAEMKVLDEVRTGVWTHVVQPSKEDLGYLKREYVLDESILNDVEDFFEVPRLEQSGSSTYFFTRYPFDEKQEDIDTAPLLIVVGESFVLTIAQREVTSFTPLISGEELISTTQKTKLFIQLMWSVTFAFEKKLINMRRAVQRDRARLRNIGPKEIARFVEYEHELNDIISSVIPTNTWLQQILNGNYLQLFSDDKDLMEDLMIANSQMIDSAKMILKTIQNVRSATEAILTSKLNTTIRTLTVLTILLTVPMIISSLYGMNVMLPLQDHLYAFWLIFLFIIMIVSLVGWYFRRSGWL